MVFLLELAKKGIRVEGTKNNSIKTVEGKEGRIFKGETLERNFL
jgi:hypothetical protein